jgi:hypothetical protein
MVNRIIPLLILNPPLVSSKIEERCPKMAWALIEFRFIFFPKKAIIYPETVKELPQ